MKAMKSIVVISGHAYNYWALMDPWSLYYLYILTLLHYSKWTQINGSSQIPTLKHIRATLFYLHIPFTINLTYTNMWSRPPHVRGQTIFIFALCFIRLPNQDLLRNMDIPPYFIINITNNSKLFCISLSLSLSMFFSSKLLLLLLLMKNLAFGCWFYWNHLWCLKGDQYDQLKVKNKISRSSCCHVSRFLWWIWICFSAMA